MKSGFQLPDNYWNDFEKKLNKRLHEADQEKLDISSGFSVPDTYFSNFKVNVEAEHPIVKYKKWLAIAAIFIALISLGIIQYNLSSQKNTVDFSSVEDKKIYQYIDNQYISEEVLDEYSKVSKERFQLEDAMQDIKDEEILSYFDDQLNDLYAYEN
ncbi:MAG: hypothetical protein RI558_06495 [Psychroflexus sp.]|nr:hypothetical protein [Psychroflexus sp.]